MKEGFIDYTEFSELRSFLEESGWKTKVCSSSFGSLSIPYILVNLSDSALASLYVHDTYYIQIISNKKTEDLFDSLTKQIRYSPNGDITSNKEHIDNIKDRMSLKEKDRLDKIIKDFYYFLKPNSIHFIGESS